MFTNVTLNLFQGLIRIDADPPEADQHDVVVHR